MTIKLSALAFVAMIAPACGGGGGTTPEPSPDLAHSPSTGGADLAQSSSSGDDLANTPPSSDDGGVSGSSDMAVTLPANGGPSAVGNLQLANQGGPNNPVTLGSSGVSLTNYQKISWTAATPGKNPVASYNIYRNGKLYDHTTELSYADTKADNSNTPTFSSATTVYLYNVSAVDSTGLEGPQAAQYSAYGYQNGVSNWNRGDLSYGGVTTDYASTNGNPVGGKYDVAANYPGMGGWLPTCGPAQAPTWDLEIGAFNYLTIDINPGAQVSSTVQLNLESRLSFGDTAAWANGFNVWDFGPAPKANTWGTYKVPLSKYHFGVSEFTGSISGTKLTVTAVAKGAVDGGGYIVGPGVPAGTYVKAYSQNASIGTFTLGGPGISDSTNVPSSSLTFQRTNFYKFGIQPNQSINGTMYFNNFGFTVN